VSGLTLADARRTASRRRMAELVRLSMGQTTVEEIIADACLPEHKALLKIRLHQLLENSPSLGPRSARERFARFARVAGVDLSTAKTLTIAWLITPQSGGQRRELWLDTVVGYGVSPEPYWEGFPWASP